MSDVLSRAIFWLRSVTFSNWIEILKLLGATAAFWIGLNQYRKSETWKRLEFVAAEIKTFYDDAAVKLAMGMLDWRRKEVALYKSSRLRLRRCKILFDHLLPTRQSVAIAHLEIIADRRCIWADGGPGFTAIR